MHAPFPRRFLIIIALEDMDVQNGLPLNTRRLSCGEFTVLSRDETTDFKKNGGGIAFFYPIGALSIRMVGSSASWLQLQLYLKGIEVKQLGGIYLQIHFK